MTKIFFLLVLFQLKHFLADYPLQGRYMLGKFRPDWSFFTPLLAHVAVHAVGTFAIAVAFGSHWALLLALFDATMHFFMDRIKAGRKYLGRFKPVTAEEWLASVKVVDACKGISRPGGEYQFHAKRLRHNDYFWWSIGLDQLVHHLTHYVVIYFLVG